MNKWINVKDELPEKGNKVLVFIDNDIEIAAYFSEWHWFDTETGEFYLYCLGDGKAISYWMPLPEKPEAKNV